MTKFCTHCEGRPNFGIVLTILSCPLGLAAGLCIHGQFLISQEKCRMGVKDCRVDHNYTRTFLCLGWMGKAFATMSTVQRIPGHSWTMFTVSMLQLGTCKNTDAAIQGTHLMFAVTVCPMKSCGIHRYKSYGRGPSFPHFRFFI